MLVFPAASPGARHRDKRLVGIVIMQHWAFAGQRLAKAQIETFRDFDRGRPGRVVAHGRYGRPLCSSWRLKADYIEQGSFTSGHATVRKPSVRAPELVKAGHALHHLGTSYSNPFQCCHGLSPGSLTKLVTRQ